jgi:hypothetical protein
MTVSLNEIRGAQRRIAGGVIVTPCPESIPLSEITGASIFCKLENFQRTGSFKERGARNALRQLTAAQQRRGVIAASAGNHALGLAYHGRLLDMTITVVMAEKAPLTKIMTCERLGARVLVRGRVIEKGLVRDGRLTRFTARISDRPGGLAEFCAAVAGASIRDIAHDRAFSGPDVSAVRVICTAETRNRAHIAALHRALRQRDFRSGERQFRRRSGVVDLWPCL